jgi:hypothetical protein
VRKRKIPPQTFKQILKECFDKEFKTEDERKLYFIKAMVEARTPKKRKKKVCQQKSKFGQKRSG